MNATTKTTRGAIRTKKTILSLFDCSGSWSKPYKEKGYDVVKVDIKSGTDIRDFEPIDCHGILAAPPCTAFSIAGNQYWAKKDKNGATKEALDLISATYRLILTCNPVWWVLENPVGRLKYWLGKPVMYFNPNDYGGWLQETERTHPLAPYQDAYQKKTCLWGVFNTPVKNHVAAHSDEKERFWVQKKKFTTSTGEWIYDRPFIEGMTYDEKRAEIRSVTPLGFARAFANANI